MLCCLVAFSNPNLLGQDSNRVHKGRLLVSTITAGGIYVGSMIALRQAWYADYPVSSFHFFNDNSEWGKMDKFGHAYSSYQLARLGYADLRWSGVDQNTAIWAGGNLGLFFLSSVEVQDAFSAGWGFSWGDMLANTMGTAFFIAQQKLWGEQRISLKYSYHKGKYANERPNVFGDNLPQKLFKDYNGQTYWLSLNINSFTTKKNFIPWLNIALGYSSDNMYYGQNPKYYPVENNIHANTFYSHNLLLSLDIDFTKIPTNKKWLKTVFGVLNIVKIPFPAIALRQDIGLKAYWLYF